MMMVMVVESERMLGSQWQKLEAPRARTANDDVVVAAAAAAAAAAASASAARRTVAMRIPHARLRKASMADRGSDSPPFPESKKKTQKRGKRGGKGGKEKKFQFSHSRSR